jgi:uncharacterized protein involved in outer membrane biogenesis
MSKTLAFQKLTQTIRDRAEEAMRLQQKDVTINVKVPHPTLGDVNLDLKIKSNKLSVDLTSNNKSMQLMLNQNRGEIKKILDGLVKDSEYELDANPVQIYNKNGEI